MGENTEKAGEELPYSEQHYFKSYDHFGIHEEMLKDETRTMSYRNAIYQNRHMFKDKVVLDVGCGTGILSMFAARSGAKHVIGVDMSNIIDMARKIVDINGLSSKITLIQGKMEEVELPFPKVDIIVSEWMGYFLLYESMLDTVLYARDKYLVEGGLIFPDKATMFIAGIEDGEYKEEKIGFWKSVYGFDYSPFQEIALAEPLVDTVELRAVVTDPSPLFELDLYTITVDDLAFTRDFSLKARRDDIVHAFIVWFDIEFSRGHKPIRFSTGPHAKYTHWKQTVFYLHNELLVCNGETVEGTLTSTPNKENPRDLDISIDHKFDPTDKTRASEDKFYYCMR
uniref:ARAD1C23936p n=1 Tax=Blastobotrys adeninivorans TaxID=409370 RepID=A0A060T2B1_BLAAD